MATGYRAGDWVWLAVTDHPRNPHAAWEGDSCIRKTQEEAQAECDSYNKTSSKWHWYPKLVRIRPRLGARGKEISKNQLPLWEEKQEPLARELKMDKEN